MHFLSYREYEFEFGDGGILCDSLIHCWAGYMDLGLRGPPAFEAEDAIGEPSIFLFNVSYNMIVILIMVAIITGKTPFFTKKITFC